MNIWQFMDRNWLLVLLVGSGTSTLIFRCWNRLMRHLNIRTRGWPPAHCDADGDVVEKPTEETDEAL